MPSISNIISKLMHTQKTERQLSAQLAVANALENEKRKRDKKRDNARRKILLGAIALKHWEGNSSAEFKLDRILDENLISKSDRALFSLPEKDSKTAVQEIPKDHGSGNLPPKIKSTNSITGAVPSGNRFAFSRSKHFTKGGNPNT